MRLRSRAGCPVWDESEQEARRVYDSQYNFLQRAGMLATRAALGLGVAAILVVPGCKSAGPKRADTDKPVNTTLSNITGEDEGLALPAGDELMSRDDDEFGSVRDQIEESARQLSVYFANLEIDGPGPAREQAQPIAQPRVERVNQPVNQPVSQSTNELINQSVNDEVIEADDGVVRVSLLGAGGQDQPDESVQVAGVDPASGLAELVEGGKEVGEPIEPAALIEQDPEMRKEQLAKELASILATLASTSDDPGSAALALASLEMLLPEGSEALFDQGVLSDAEQTSLDAARTFLRSLSAEGSIASPAAVASELEAIQAKLDAWAGVTIKKAALCTRVDGYGWYETFPSYRFVAGRAQPVIVYVELERFAQREFVGPDGQARYETKLSQRLELYHVADDLNTWNRQAETVTGETRNRLRDYYLTNKVTLPANLGVGRYHLKVVMRDFIGERVAETIIPIEIVVR